MARNTANFPQLKLMARHRSTGLSAELLQLFRPRPPLEYKPPVQKPKLPQLSGIAQFVNNFAEPQDPNYAPPPQPLETRAQKRARIHKLKLEKGAEKIEKQLQEYNPKNDPNLRGDPYKTLFVSDMSYQTTEEKVKREFEAFGPVKQVHVVYDKRTNKPRGYAFVEFVDFRDFNNAYKQADGIKIDNRRVAVDVERGRTVQNWRPRRLGGGLGTCRQLVGKQLRQASASRQPSITENDRERSRDRDRRRSRGRDRGSRERSGGRDNRRYRDGGGERGHVRGRDRVRRD